MVKLEQNYRSTQNILKVANEVIRNNHSRKTKTLWTENDEGNWLPCSKPLMNGRGVVGGGDSGRADPDRRLSLFRFRFLYWTNAQSRVFEEILIQKAFLTRWWGSVS